MQIKKGLIALFFLGLLVGTSGSIGLQSPLFFVKNQVQDSQRTTYEMRIVSADLIVNESENVEIVMNYADPEKSSRVYSFYTDGERTPKNTFTVEKTSDNAIKINSDVPVFFDIRPELPNLITLPENSNDPGAHWIRNFNQSGEYLTEKGLNNYFLTGITEFTNIGREKITIKSGTFDCIGIKQVANYSMTGSLTSGNETLLSEKAGEFSGESWVDSKTGILVRSSFDKHTINTIDLSETYKKMYGVEKMYRTVPLDLRLTTELVQGSPLYQKMNLR